MPYTQVSRRGQVAERLKAAVCQSRNGPQNGIIRLSIKDLEAILKRALAEGLPYQILISSLLHKCASGRLKEICGPSSSTRSLRPFGRYGSI